MFKDYTNPLYSTKRFLVHVITVQSDKMGPVAMYGVINKETGVTEHYSYGLSDAMAKADVEEVVLENGWHKMKASMEIDLLSAMYDKRLAS